MGALDLTLIDANALAECARDAGLTEAQARAFCACLGELDPRQIVRIIGGSFKQREDGDERERRKTWLK